MKNVREFFPTDMPISLLAFFALAFAAGLQGQEAGEAATRAGLIEKDRASADAIASRFYHAMGYRVPANNVVYFTQDQLEVVPDVQLTDAKGKVAR